MAQRALLLFQSYQGFGEWSPDIAAPTKRRGAGEIIAQVNSVRNESQVTQTANDGRA